MGECFEDELRWPRSGWVSEKIITSETTEGVPIIVLANKQDLPNSLKVHEIKEVFNRIALRLGARESSVRGVSALTGCVARGSRRDFEV